MKKYIYGLLAISLIANGLFILHIKTNSEVAVVQSPLATPDQIEVIRTKGGLLQVSTLKTTEIFESSQNHQIFGLLPIGKTTTQIRVPAVFNYHIALAPEWRVMVRGKEFIVVAPSVAPTLPVAVDLSRLQYFSSGTWSVLTSRSQTDSLQKTITKKLETKALNPTYIQYQRATARKTVEEFVQKWLTTQAKWQEKGPYNVQVYFSDEPIKSLPLIPRH